MARTFSVIIGTAKLPSKERFTISPIADVLMSVSACLCQHWM